LYLAELAVELDLIDMCYCPFLDQILELLFVLVLGVGVALFYDVLGPLLVMLLQMVEEKE
jgi:hypothetical protein